MKENHKVLPNLTQTTIRTISFLKLRPFFLLLTILILSAALPLNAQQFYVSPAGASNGDGSKGRPWDLQTALNQPASVIPGSTIYLLSGTYNGNYTSLLTGTVAKPIIVRNEPGGRVIIDGRQPQSTNTLFIKGAYTWFWGFEVMNSNPQRVLTTTGSNPQGTRGEGLYIFGIGIKIINMIIYDNSDGIGAWSIAADNEYYGNVVFNNGWIAPDRNHGHGIYSQNNTGTKSFFDNIVTNNFDYGIQVYGSSTAQLNNYNFDGNILYNDRWLVGGAGPARNITISNSFTYQDTLEFGWGKTTNDGLTLTNNVFASPVEIKYWNNVTATGNTFYDGPAYAAGVYLIFNGTPNFSTYKFNYNTYYWSNPAPAAAQPEPFVYYSNASAADNDPNKSGPYLLSKWKQMGKDINSTVKYFPQKNASNMALNGIKTFVRKNKYDPSRAHIVVYNYDRANTVQADVSGILSPGDTYELHNAADYFGDVITSVYSGGALSISMTGHTVAKPIGYNGTMGQNSFPEFGTFVLIKKNASSTPTVAPFQFLSFQATRQNNDVLLQWSTTGETNNKNFSVERSADGVNFTGITTIAATANPQATNNYQYLHTAPTSGTYSYRIKQINADNSFTYSSVQQVVIPAATSAATFSFIDVKASLQNNNVQVNWSTPLERDSKNFSVERSTDGVNFTTITTITATSNPQAANIYGYIDVTPAPATYTYRVKRVAVDNSFLYSATQQVVVPGTAVVKPFSFLSFQATRQNNDVLLQWSTTGETNNKNFSVERSADGVNFTGIATIAATANPQATNNYQYLHTALTPGTYSYRIKQINTDNSFTYSSVQQVVIPAVVKPFSFLSFQATRQNNDVLLQWSTTGETNNKNFSVERSADGVNFAGIATVAATANPQATNNYQYLNTALTPGTYSYRIKQINADNSFTYSSVQQVVIPAVVKPFSFLSFQATRQNNDVLLQWSTTGETNNKNFSVERSADGVNFTGIATIAATANPQATNNYQYLHTALTPGTYSYRIKQINADNSFTYSSVQQVVIPAVVKPFSFLSFQATRQNNDVLLQWSTTGETNNKNFSVERSADGVNFTGIATIAATANPQATNNYQYLHTALTPGTYSYRIKQINADNSFTYSSVQQVMIPQPPQATTTGSFDFTILQNPAVDNLLIGLKLTQLTALKFELKTATGQLLYSDQKTFGGNYTYSIPVGQYLKGTYFITVTTAAGAVTKQFTIEKGFDFTILQNPVISNLQLSLNLPALTTMKFEIKDALGQLRYTDQKTYAGVVNRSIPVTQLKSGMYYITVITSSGAISKSFIKQ